MAVGAGFAVQFITKQLNCLLNLPLPTPIFAENSCKKIDLKTIVDQALDSERFIIRNKKAPSAMPGAK